MITKLTAIEDISAGSVLSRRKNNRVRAAVTSSRYENFLGLLAHDCKQGDVLIYDDRRNTDDITISGRLRVEELTLDSNIYLTK